MTTREASAASARMFAGPADDPITPDAPRALRRKVVAIHAIQRLAIALIIGASLVAR